MGQLTFSVSDIEVGNAQLGTVATVTASGVSFVAPTTGIGGGTGTVDNSVLRADGTGGNTAQSSGATISDFNEFVIGDLSSPGKVAVQDSAAYTFSRMFAVYLGGSFIGQNIETFYVQGDGYIYTQRGLKVSAAGATGVDSPKFILEGGWGGLYRGVTTPTGSGNQLTNLYGLQITLGTGKECSITSGLNPASLSVYNTYTSATSFENLRFRWGNNVCIIETAAGSAGGVVRDLSLSGGILIDCSNSSVRTITLKDETPTVTTNKLYNNNGTLYFDGGAVGGSGGGIGGSTGSTDNAILRADGTGGSAVQGSAWTIDDSGVLKSGNSSFQDNTGSGFGLRVQAANSKLTAFGVLSLMGYYSNNYWILGNASKASVIAMPASGPSGKENTVELKAIDGTHVRNITETSPTLFAVYNTWTSSTSYERVDIGWSANVCTIQTTAGSAGGTKRGLQIGGASTDELGFFGATPVDQPATVSDPSGGSTVDTEARAAIAGVIDRLQELGLMA